MIEFVIGAWTSVAMFLFGASYSSESVGPKDLSKIFALCFFWPITIMGGFIYLTYDSYVSSSRRILTDIRNRKLMKEFDEFLEQRKNKECPSETTNKNA